MSPRGGNKFVGRKPGEPLLPAGDDERLRWLEGDEEADESGLDTSLDTGRVLALLAGAGLLLAMVAAGLWWLLDARTGSRYVADGSLIEAPEGPYKIRPAEPGGRELQGTGDVSFAVAEGKERVGTIDDEPREETGGIGVQVGAFPSREEASAGWARMVVRIPSLQGRSHLIVEGSADSGAIFRLQAMAGSAADARELCLAIRSEGGDCQVKN